MAGADSALLDFGRPFDVALLDATVNLFYTSTNNDEVRVPASAAGAHHTGGRADGRVGTFPGSPLRVLPLPA